MRSKKGTMGTALVLAALIVACSSRDDEDDGCTTGIGERPCTVDTDCDGYTGSGIVVIGERSPACAIARCEANKCAVTYTTARLADDVDGDCKRPICNADGFVVHADDTSDVGSSLGGECRVLSCEPAFFGLSVVAADAPDDTSCSLAAGTGVCRAGRCVEKTDDPRPGHDAGDGGDAGVDGGETDGGESDAAPE